MTEMKYKAFISYSHYTDHQFAPSLQQALETFSKKWYQIRKMRIFRDETDLSIAPSLWGEIVKALNQSEYFIYLASPKASKSKWVKKEIDWWINNKKVNNLIIVQTQGEIEWNDTKESFNWDITNSIPINLDKIFIDEPLFIDMKWVKNTKTQLTTNHPRFVNDIATISSCLLNIDKEKLIGFSVTQKKQRNILISSFLATLLTLLILSIFSSYSFMLKKKEAEKSLKISQERLKDAVGVYWLYLLISDYSDGKIDKNKSLDKILTVLKSDNPERIVRVASLMEKYISIKGAIFDAKKDKYKNIKTNISLPIFTNTYTSIYSRNPKYTTELFILEAPYIISTWNDEEIKSLYLLLQVLLDKNHPKIFKRYGKSMKNDERDKLLFMSLVLESTFSTAKNTAIHSLIKHKYFRKYFDNLYYWSFFLNENLKENGEIIRNYGVFSDKKFPDLIKRIGRISENFYSYIIQNKHALNKDVYIKIIDFCVNGIYLLNLETQVDNVKKEISNKNNPNWIIFKEKKYDQAINEYKKILNIRKNDYYALLGIANIHLNNHNYDIFIQQIKFLSEKWPTEKKTLERYKDEVLNIINDTNQDLKKLLFRE